LSDGTAANSSSKTPNVPDQSGHPGGRRALFAAVILAPCLPATIAIAREHGESRFELAEFLRERERQAVQSLQAQPLGSIQPFDVARSYRLLFAVLYAPYPGPPE
jgi:hypothetical protein